MVKILLDATFSGYPLTESYCVNECIAKNYTKIIGNIFSGRLDVHLQVIQPILIATNQRVVAAQRQQRGLVAVTIRGSVLFYSSAI